MKNHPIFGKGSFGRYWRLGRIPIRLLALMLCGAIFAPPVFAADQETLAPGRVVAQHSVWEKELWITADHTQHEILQQPFSSGPEVTRACLSCHNQAAFQFHQTIHWTWMDPHTAESARLGKGGLSINNF